MEKRNIKLTMAMTALVLTGGISRAAERATLAVVLHLTDLASTDKGDLARARAEAQRIFDDVGVRLVWADIADGPTARACEGMNLFVSFLSPYLIRQRKMQGGSESVLGSASPSTRHAFIFSERISSLAPRRRIDEGVLLGRVIAHELGHLLLTEQKHSLTGLMAAGMETDPTGLTTFFLPSERRAIQARLESKVAALDAKTSCETESAARER